jgi:hypothetical protein
VAEHIILVAQPRGTRVAWLAVLLHYGHTLSGTTVADPTNPILAAFAAQTGVQLTIASTEANHSAPAHAINQSRTP